MSAYCCRQQMTSPQVMPSAAPCRIGDASAAALALMVLDMQPDLTIPLARLRSRYPDCWTYKVEGVFGASPELLLRAERGEVSARVLAGTAGRGTDPGIDQAIGTALSSSHKNIEEHRFAVESLVAALEPFCSHVDADPKPFSLSLPNVWHLASDVYGVLRENISSLDLAGALHPTAAVAGTPRETAQALISGNGTLFVQQFRAQDTDIIWLHPEPAE